MLYEIKTQKLPFPLPPLNNHSYFGSTLNFDKMSKRIASGEAVKRPGAVKDFNLFPTSTEEMPEGWLMISLLCGSLAIVLKVTQNYLLYC